MTTETVPLQAGDVENSTSALTRWYVLTMMCVVYTLSIADRYVTSNVLEPIRLDLHLSDSQIAFVTGVALAWFYVVLGFPISWLIDRYSRRGIIALSMIAWSAMTTFTGMVHSVLQFLVARIGVGVGEAGGTPGANSLLSDYFPARRRPMALTVFSLGAPIGAWLAAWIASTFVDRYGWRQVFYVLGIPGVIAGILILLTIREPQRGQLDRKADESAPSIRETLRFLLAQRSAVHVIAGTALCALWGWGLMYWTPTFLQRMYHLSAGQASAVLEPMHLIGGSAATVFTAWLIGRPAMTHPCRIVRLMGYWIGAATIVSIVIYWTHSLALTKALLWIFVPSIYFYIGPGFGILNNLAQPRMRAVFCATVLFVANVCNLVIAPQMVGFLSDAFAPPSGPTAESLRIALLFLAPTGFWATAHLFLSLKRLIADQERATGIRVC
ncbi:MAG TPA: MFS transporter [Steroidobacteraceae bacterium]|nr:MFS transporter [Steroidobacteraceae bacterium]